MNKVKMFVDFDNSLVNTTKKFCEIYSELYKNHIDFIQPKWQLVDKYNFSDQCPLIEKVEEIFKMELFFKDLEFINPNTYEILEELNEKYQIIICSIGEYQNISYKTMWVKENLPFIKDSIFIVNEGCKMTKSLANMSDLNSIFIDDVESNLISSNAPYKILFGELHQWNKNWTGQHCIDWSSVKEYLDSIQC